MRKNILYIYGFVCFVPGINSFRIYLEILGKLFYLYNFRKGAVHYTCILCFTISTYLFCSILFNFCSVSVMYEDVLSKKYNN